MFSKRWICSGAYAKPQEASLFCVLMCMSKTDNSLRCCSSGSVHLFLKTASLLGLEVTKESWLSGQGALGIHSSLPPQG